MSDRTLTAETLRALIALVEEAKAGSRELDEAIHGALLPNDPWWQAILDGRRLVAAGKEGTKIDACNCNLRADSWATSSRVHSYTTSIDAALALVAKVLPESRPHDVLHDAIERMNLTGWRADAPQVPQLALHVIGEMLERLMPSEETAHVER